MKTTEEIIAGLELRIKRLNETLDIISKCPENLGYTKNDTEVRLDELESLLEWIKKL